MPAFDARTHLGSSEILSSVVPPTRIEAMYAPEVFGRTAASTLSVKAK